MLPWRPRHQRGFGLLVLMIGAAIGILMLGGLSFLYVAVVRALDQSSSQAALQRVGTLAVQAISRQAVQATSLALTCGNPAPPGGTTGRSLEVFVRTVPYPDPNNPSHYGFYYCYYAGNGSNGAAAGALCQRRTALSNGVLAAPGPCWNLLAAPQAGLTRLPGQTPISLIKQTNPASTLCPRNTDAPSVDLPSGQYCLALNVQNTTTGDVAFAITDGVNSVTFTVSLWRQNS